MLSLADLNLRQLKEVDLEMVLTWRNSEHVRRYSLKNHTISCKEHHEWYNSICGNPTCEWLIVELKNEPVGVISIVDINRNDSTCTWGMYIGDVAGNLGIGVLMEILAIDRVFDFHGIRKLWGQALKSNRILVTHKRFGFTEEGVLRSHVYRNGQYEDVVLIALFKEQWSTNRKEIFAKFNLADE